jgi:hypothetical protein
MRKKSRWGLVIGMGAAAFGIMVVEANATSSPSSSLPAAKQQIESNYDKLKQNSYAAPKSSDTSLKPVQHEQLPSGVQNEFTPPFHADDVTISNVWQKEINGQLVQVYAGKVSKDASQGIVVVQTTSADGVTTREQRFLTPEKTGSLKIAAENNLKLSIQSEQGAAYEYDVQAKSLAKK